MEAPRRTGWGGRSIPATPSSQRGPRAAFHHACGRAHRHSQPEQHVARFLLGRGGPARREERPQRHRVVRHVRLAPVEELDLLALEDGDVPELRGVVGLVFHHEQTGAENLQDETRRGNRPRGSPDHGLAALAPDAKMNAGPRDGRRQSCEGPRPQGQRVGEAQRLDGVLRREESQDISGAKPSSRCRLAQKAASINASMAVASGRSASAGRAPSAPIAALANCSSSLPAKVRAAG